MPTVPREQNRVGIVDVTNAKLQPGDYSGTGLQALGAGMQQLGGTGARIAGEVQERQARNDEFEVKKAWNAYAEGARGIRTDALGKAEADPQDMLESMTRDYGGLRDWIRSGLKNDRQRGQFDQVIAERFDYDISGALAEAGQALRRGQDQQSVLLERNAADDAADNADDPVLFDKHLHTGIDSIVARGMRRGDDPAAIDRSTMAYGSDIRRRVVQGLTDRDPVAAANRYWLMRDAMTPSDRQATEEELFEPLARALAAKEVDKLLPPGERDGTLSPERQAAIAQEIKGWPLTEALKRYALDDLDERASLQARSRKQVADAAREIGLARADQLGSDFTSITQIPAAVRRDLDEEADQALRSLARANLDPTRIAPGGEAALMMNIMASENPAAFAKEDLRLVRGKVTREEYDRFVQIQHGLSGSRPPIYAVIQRRTLEQASYPRDAAWRAGDNPRVFPVVETTKRNAQGPAFATGTEAKEKARKPHEIYVVDGEPHIGTQHIRSPEDQASNRKITEEDMKNPALMAFLTLVSITEGTNGHHQYYERYGRKRLKDLKKFYYGTGISDASGMFQIQGRTYDEIAVARLGLNDFSPQTQRMTAMFLLRKRGVRERLLAGDIEGAIAKGADEWASLPDPVKNTSKYMKSGTKRLQPSIDIAEAVTMYKRLRAIWEKKLGPSSPSH
ncbi:hypothetical protein NDN01_23905 [Sphingomonas sp. QA11]|uniref:hypothetical protein n=1 Tax=Sphingomonas sp. QA11 TaxID=2950605 RepID=UPI00234AC6B5|nr:hypothetical protein [Sphingomonas sp. QA11]WCM26992.1 hypothetical protein NDN01_23905 [Sphingomonas sp. QA11]